MRLEHCFFIITPKLLDCTICYPSRVSTAATYICSHCIFCRQRNKNCDMTNESLKTGEFILSDVHEVLYDVLGGMGRFFYICDVAKTSYKHVDEVPDFYRNAWPNVLLLMALENVVLYVQHKPLLRFNDGLTSLSLGLMQELGRILFRGSETSAYIFIYNNWRLVELPWNSPVTWYIAFFLVDFFYYWGHRASHEINLFWAQHQVHHSSEEYNFPVGLRQSFFQGWCSFVFYLPMALFIPPSHFVVHKQLNLLYQVWIHTKIINTLGPLEYVLNTPQHHRVHHACNKRYLDRNYGGVLIIWDRLFSTFASEDTSQDIVYGLVEQQPCFNPLYLQVYYNRFVAGKFSSFNEYHNKFLSLIKGPSWVPGAPWTGFEKDKLDIKPREAHDVRIPHWCNFYVLLHFTLVLMGFHYEGYTVENLVSMLIYTVVVIWSLTSIGIILDDHPNAPYVEAARCCFCIFLTSQCDFLDERISFLIQLVFHLSGLFWSFRCIKTFETRIKSCNK